jgi:hypothetical protein
LPQRLKLRNLIRNVLLLIGVVLRSRIIPRKKWRVISAIWKVIRLAWCPRREPGIVHAVWIISSRAKERDLRDVRYR